ncbi:MAG: hypothetical protein ACFFER_17405 [Candidatus Thorarchaeota archaeon]
MNRLKRSRAVHRWFLSSFAIGLILLVSLPFANGVGTPGPTITTPQDFDPGWSVEFDESLEGSLDFFGLFGVSCTIDAHFFTGIELPLTLIMKHPEWLQQDCLFTLNASVIGQHGRAGIDIGAGLRIAVHIGMFSFDVLNERRDLDLSIDYNTPIGWSFTGQMSDRVELSHITVPILDYTMAAYVGVKASVGLEGQVSCDLDVTGPITGTSSLIHLIWDEIEDSHVYNLQTTKSASSDVVVNQKDTTLTLDSFTISLTAFFIDLEVPGIGTSRLEIAIPPDLFASRLPADYDFPINPSPIHIPVHVSTTEIIQSQFPEETGILLAGIGMIVIVAIVLFMRE